MARTDPRGVLHRSPPGQSRAAQILQSSTPLRAALPLGYRIEVGGAIEDSAKGQSSIAAGVPLLRHCRADAADDPAAELLAHADGRADRAARPDRRHARAARVRQAVRLRRDARHDRAVRHHHAQLGDPGRPDRPGHRGGARAVGRGRSARPCAASARSCSPRRPRCSR